MSKDQISICICTYKRPQHLEKLLGALAELRSNELFNYSIVVADNDKSRSAEPVVAAFAAKSQIATTYCMEAQPNIAKARNLSVKNSDGNFVAFIDDDEFPEPDWLCCHYDALHRFGAAGVLGPVKPYFEVEPPAWMTKGGFFERPSHPTGYKLEWSQTRTGNVLFRKSILSPGEPVFLEEFNTGGEDLDFFRRLMAKGCLFVWCDAAVVYEAVPPSRCNRGYLLKRALLRGSNFPKQRGQHARGAVNSIIALPCYTLMLPFLALFGQHVFFKYAIKICDHFSRLLALMGLPLVTTRDGIA